MVLINVATLVINLVYNYFIPSTLSSPPCGTILKTRIVGGIESDYDEWPWMASIKSIGLKPFCGGVLVSERHVVTAAHCIYVYKYIPYVLRVKIGSSTSFWDEFLVNEIAIHPTYKRDAPHDSDVAVLTLLFPIRFNRGVSFICLPDTNMSINTNNPLVALGRGRDHEHDSSGPKGEILRQVSLQKFHDSRCEIYDNLWLPRKMLCVGWSNGGKDTCQGDSGGPLIQKDLKGKWNVFGITSFGFGCGRADYPGVYTNVAYFRTWMDQVIN